MRIQEPKREKIIDGMEAIICRKMRVAPRGDLVLVTKEYSPRELAIKLLSFIEARDSEQSLRRGM